MTCISIICTVKNGEKTLIDTIESVINQTFKEWEFIIVDDGSTDNTLEILNTYSIRDSRIKIINTTGIGRGKALNLAVRACKSDYILNIDSDDIMHPKKINIQYSVIRKNPEYFLLCTKNKIIFNQDKITWGKINFINEDKVEDITEKNFKKNQIDHSSVIMRKEYLNYIGGYDEERKSQFDYELWLRAALAGYKLGKINLELVAKRIHKNQSFERNRLTHLFRSVVLQTKYIIKVNKIHFIVYPIGRFFIGLLPFQIRQMINKVINL